MKSSVSDPNIQAYQLHPILLTALVPLLPSVRAHGHIVSWDIGGESKPGFNPYWVEELGPTAERPTDNEDEGFADFTKPIVACGGLSAPDDVLTWDVEAGSTVLAHWDFWDWGHRVQEYMAACPSRVDAASLGWFKISEAGWDGKEFASETINRTRQWEFTIPPEIAPGYYLVRHAIMALHDEALPQVYPVCFQANVKSSGTLKVTDTVTFPEAYDINDNFKTFNIYYGSDFDAFSPPGPPVFDKGQADGSTQQSGGDKSMSEATPKASATLTTNRVAAEETKVSKTHCKRRRRRTVRRLALGV